MDNYTIIKSCLKSFVDETVTIPAFQYSSVEEIANRHLVTPIIQYVCGNYNEKEGLRNKLNHYQRLKKCKNIFQLLDSKSIPYVVIKGAYLEKVAYKHKGLRASNDIDILIRKKDYTRIKEMFLANGFDCVTFDWKNQKYVEGTRNKILFNLLYTHQSCGFLKMDDVSKNSIKVDINFSITWGEDDGGSSISNSLINEVRTVNYDGISYKVFVPEVFLFQECLHSYRDMNSILLLKKRKYKLIRLCDVYYYIANDKENIDADIFINLVKETGYVKPIYHILYDVSEYFGCNDWISYVMKAIEPIDKDFINNFGLSQNEMKPWPINFKERVLSEHLFNEIEHLLTEEDIEKINSIIENM